jgi:uncharacterized membrane protein
MLVRRARKALVRFPGSWQIGFVMDSLSDGRQVIFIPGVPRAMVGTLHILPDDQVQPLPDGMERVPQQGAKHNLNQNRG